MHSHWMFLGLTALQLPFQITASPLFQQAEWPTEWPTGNCNPAPITGCGMSSNKKVFALYDNTYFANGGSYRTSYNVRVLQDCMNLCASDSNCYYFVYYKENHHGPPYCELSGKGSGSLPCQAGSIDFVSSALVAQ